MISCKTRLSLTVLFLATVPLALAQGTYTQIDVPAALYTACSGINAAGQIVGWYVDSSHSYRGFLLSDGTYTTIDYIPQTGAGTTLSGINNVGQIVGSTVLNTFGFIYDIQTHPFTTLDSAPPTYANGINDAGTIVGYNASEAFELLASGHHRTLAVPGASYTFPLGISAAGRVVGPYQTSNFYSFLYDAGRYRRLLPNVSSQAAGINPAGTMVVGTYVVSNVQVGFLYANNALQTLQFPGSFVTLATGVNDTGEVVGHFTDFIGGEHGFTWMPDAPAGNKK